MSKRSRRSQYWWQATLAILLLAPAGVIVSAQEVGADNTAKYLGSGRYAWTVFIVAKDKSILTRIRYVEYTLYPTFPNHVRRVDTPGNNHSFPLSEKGWGEFDLGIKVAFDGEQISSFSYHLNLFDKAQPEKAAKPKPKPRKKSR